MKRAKAILLTIAAGVAMAGVLATPAQAATTANGCTVDPITPYHNGEFDASGNKRIRYDISVTCVGGVSIEIQQQRWEQDSGPSADDLIGTTTLNSTFNSAGSITRWVEASLPDTDDGPDFYEEMYQRVRFRVTSGPVTSGWTAWESSGVRSIHV